MSSPFLHCVAALFQHLGIPASATPGQTAFRIDVDQGKVELVLAQSEDAMLDIIAYTDASIDGTDNARLLALLASNAFGNSHPPIVATIDLVDRKPLLWTRLDLQGCQTPIAIGLLNRMTEAAFALREWLAAPLARSEKGELHGDLMEMRV